MLVYRRVANDQILECWIFRSAQVVLAVCIYIYIYNITIQDIYLLSQGKVHENWVPKIVCECGNVEA